MAYNPENLLRRIIEAQDVVLEQQELHRGIPLIEIYRNTIAPRYHISYSTFNKWMRRNARNELEKCLRKKKEIELRSNS